MATFVRIVSQDLAPVWTKRKGIRLISPFLRLHHGKPCPYCGDKMDKHGDTHTSLPSRDHVIPRSKGGKITIAVCGRCNNEKRDMMPDEYIATLSGCRRTKTLIAIIGVLIPAAAAEELQFKESFSTTAMEDAFKVAAG